MIDVYLTNKDGWRLLTPSASLPPKWSVGLRGAASAEATFPATLQDALRITNQSGLIFLNIRENGNLLWRGRAEVPRVSRAGLTVTAYGLARAFADTRYTALWSHSGSADWREVTPQLVSYFTPSRFNTDNNNRLYFEVVKNTDYTTGYMTGLFFAVPDKSARYLRAISFNYSITVAGSFGNCEIRVRTYDATMTQIDNVSVAATTSSTSGSYSNSGFTGNAVYFVVQFWRAGTATYTGETGDTFAICTNIRIATTVGEVYAFAIAQALYDHVVAINPGQLTGALIDGFNKDDLLKESYEDLSPYDILDRLAFMNSATWGVDNRGQFFWRRTVATPPRVWRAIIDLESFAVESDMDEMYNSAYAVHSDANNRTLRTAVASKALSIENIGVTRQRAVSASTTSLSVAEAHRDAFLVDSADRDLRTNLIVRQVKDEAGANRPLYSPVPGDLIIVDNLPAYISPQLEKLRKFILGYLEYDHATNEAIYQPYTPPSSLATLIARREAGL